VAEREDRDEDEAEELPLEPEPASDADAHPESRRRRLERLLPGLIKRAIEKGIETGIGSISQANDSIRSVVGGKTDLPKEVAGYVFSQVDETKNAMVRVVAREVREFLEAADLAQELQKVLTTLSFEIRTEIRFVPNDSGGITPDVKARVGPRIASERTRARPSDRRRRPRRPSAEPQDDEGNEPDPDAES
jgi:hypothetical protein